MALYKIVSEDEPRYVVHLGECSRYHADSVLEQLQHDPTVPDNLRLKKKPLLKRKGRF